ncbi:Glucosyltransferase MdoH [Polymorphum gilvum SL003B-26A1]|uniref:Glucans biosynthesis glucosyltransferase H n=1 Tax=Polymorphum gilvum (strain LMG 25793 / CGMCC 1.9160 / SL003B-26A1) TaxID=991905 RepID=F2J5I0_POLGS|nr:Glucosyltransferase MdoH [Polymorphum gilvum SL003B-26A1]
MMTWRRVLFAALCLASVFGLATLMVLTLAPGGYGLLDLAVLACFAVTLPWTVIGFWNAVIGLLVMRLARDPVHAVCPLAAPDPDRPLACRTAVLSCIRNEDVTRVETNLNAMIAALVRSGHGRAFSIYILSDSDDEAITAQEEASAMRLAERWHAHMPVTYRRRDGNLGFKAGNIEDFCDRWGAEHDFALVLDADSYLSADTILDLVRHMEVNPRLGILQTLVVGLPTPSAFARVFQFGMRLGMRSYTLGSAWWQGDCGPYWGHNAILRLRPFMDHCRLPRLAGAGPLAGWVLSHDQVEATLMRRAGYEVRVLPCEGGSFEENPPHLLEFIRRDLRWCQGNLQYVRLLGLPGLQPVSRAQLVLAILMFLGSPAWIGFMISAALLGLTAEPHQAPFRADTGYALFIAILTMVFAPKLATVADILARADLRRAFGGAPRILVGTATEILYSAMLAPVMAIAHSLFMGGLVFGKAVGWGAQGRALARLPVTLAARKLWPQTLFGVLATAWISAQPLDQVWPLLPIGLGPLLAIPFAVALSSPAVGRLAIGATLWRIPEETDPPAALTPLQLPALSGTGQTPRSIPIFDLPAEPAPVRAPIDPGP